MRIPDVRVGHALVLLLCLLASAEPVSAQLNISGQADILGLLDADTRGLNRNFRTDSPYNQVRARLFLQHWVSERIGVFAELLFDDKSGPRLNGAYVVMNDIAGKHWLSTRVGMAPSLIGNFGQRSTYFNANPLIGIPLVWQHRTTFDGSGLATNADLIRRRAANFIALPMLYDSCWNIVWELMGEAGKFEYSVAITPGSMSNPLASQPEPGVQAMARVGFVPSEGLRLGLSGGVGPYLAGVNRDPQTLATKYPGSQTDYNQYLVGFDGELTQGKTVFHTEGYVSTFEAPLIDEDLTMTGGYVEGRYDFLPQWFAAVRTDGMIFSQIDVPRAAEDSFENAERTGWDDDIFQVESSLTYRIAREVQLRGGWQHTRFLTGGEKPINLLAVQLRAVF